MHDTKCGGGVPRRRFLGMAGAALGALAAGCTAPTPTSPPLPNYVDDGRGWPVFRGPYSQQNAQLAALLLPADVAALQKLCDAAFNTPPSGAVNVTPFGPYVVLVYADMHIQSQDERDHEVGRLPETEVGFWIPVWVKASEAANSRRHLAWFLPYVFVDNPYAIATGREVYGFPKTFGQFAPAADITHPEFAVDVWSFETTGAEAEGRLHPLLSVKALNTDTPSESWTTWDAARSTLIQWLFADWEPPSEVEDTSVWLQQVERMPLIFLKQFRDAADTAKACYQAIIEAELHLQTFYGGGLAAGEYAVTFQTSASHPLADVMRLQTDADHIARALAVFWLHLDFELGLGAELWRYGS